MKDIVAIARSPYKKLEEIRKVRKRQFDRTETKQNDNNTTMTKSFLSGAALGTATIAILWATLELRRRHRYSKNERQPCCAHGSELRRRAPKRCGATIQLKPDHYQAYTRLHDDVWPQVLERMSRSNVRNFTIYYHKETNTLYSHFEWIGHWRLYPEKDSSLVESITSIKTTEKNDEKASSSSSIQITEETKEKEEALFKHDMEAIANDPIVRRWWGQCEPCQIPFPGQWPPEEPPPSQGGKGGDWWKPLVCVCHCGHWPVEYSEERRDPEFVKLSDGVTDEAEEKR